MIKLLITFFLIPFLAKANLIDDFNKKINRNFFKKESFTIESNSINKHLGADKKIKLSFDKNILSIDDKGISESIKIELIDKVNYLLGPDFSKLFEGYKIKYKKEYYTALDLSGEKEVSEYNIVMSGNTISRVVMKRAVGTTTFYYKWGFNNKLKKYYVKSVQVKSFEGVYNKVKDLSFIYTTKGSNFYPAYIGEVTSVHLVSAKLNKKISKNFVDWVKFKNTQ